MFTIILLCLLALMGVWVKNLYDRVALANEEVFVTEQALAIQARRNNKRVADLAAVTLKWQARAHDLAEQLGLSRRTTVVVMEHYEQKILDGYVMGTGAWIDRATHRNPEVVSHG